MGRNINIVSGHVYRATSRIDGFGELFIEFIELELDGAVWVDMTNGNAIMTGAIHGVKFVDDVVSIQDGDGNTYQLNEDNCKEFDDAVLSAEDIYDAIVAAYTSGGASGPINTVAPTTTGNDYVGQVLSGTDGTWTGTAPITYEYQWQRDGVDIPSATASTFTLTSADADEYITCTVTATNDFGSGSSVSNQVLVSINWGLGCAKNWGDSTNAVWGV